MDTLLELAGRCEAYDPKTCPDNRAFERPLEADIHEALGNCVHRETERYAVQSDTGFTCKACGVDMYGNRKVPAYCSSLDAAMTLVPEGWSWDADATVPKYGVDWQLWSPNDPPKRVEATARTPCLALTAACLRALASKDTPHA